MKHFVLAPLATRLLWSLRGCGGIVPNAALVSNQEVDRGDYGNKKLPAVGPMVSTMVQPSIGDNLYYGACEGPLVSEQIQQERRFESFCFGNDYMDEGQDPVLLR